MPQIEKTISRDASLIAIEYWYKGAVDSFDQFYGFSLYPEQAYIYRNGIFEFYRDNERLFNELPYKIRDWLKDGNEKKLHSIYKQLTDSLQWFKKLELSSDMSDEAIMNILYEAGNHFMLGFPGIFTTHWVPIMHNKHKDEKLFDQKFINEIIQWRKSVGNIFYDKGVSTIDMILEEIARRKKWKIENVRLLTIEELKQSVKSTVLPKGVINKRRKIVFAYVDFQVVYEPDIESKLAEMNYEIKEPIIENIKEIKGNPAYSGVVQGTVKVVFNKHQLDKIKDGDILIAPMTSPWYLPIMKKVAAFVTDEGGITCHAAIIARELNKPCIIGTKLATKIFKDGDMVEVDANNGIVKKIKQKIIIVDRNDNIIGYKDAEVLKKEDIYRVSALWVTNSNKEILLARRHRSKSHHPRKWGPAVAGTVDEGESYEENIIKEAEEELGLKNIKPIPGPKTKTEGKYHHFTQWYTLIIDKNISEFKIQKDEVEEIKWFSREELSKELETHPKEFLPRIKKYLELF